MALGNVGRPEDAALAEPYAADGDPLLREHASWALGRLESARPEQGAAPTSASAGSPGSGLAPFRSPCSRPQSAPPYPPGHEAVGLGHDRCLPSAASSSSALAQGLDAKTLSRIGLAALTFDFAIVSSFVFNLTFEPGTAIRQVLVIVLIEAAFRYGIRGGALVAASAPVLAIFEWLRARRRQRGVPVRERHAQLGIEVIVALVVGWLVLREGEARDRRRAQAGG